MNEMAKEKAECTKSIFIHRVEKNVKTLVITLKVAVLDKIIKASKIILKIENLLILVTSNKITCKTLIATILMEAQNVEASKSSIKK